MLVPGVVSAQVQDCALAFVDPHETTGGQVSLTGSTTNPPHFESSAMLLRVDLCIFTNTSHDFKSSPLFFFFLFVLLV